MSQKVQKPLSHYRFREEIFRSILQMQGAVNPPIVKPKNNYFNVTVTR